MFELTSNEMDNLRSHFATSSWGGTRYAPFVFTELGVAMLSSVLRSETAININRGIMRAFVAMRNYLAANTILSSEIAEIRTKLQLLERNDEDNMEAINDLSEDLRSEINNIYTAIAELSVKLPKISQPRRSVGY